MAKPVFTMLASFDGQTVGYPYGSLIVDAAGNLFGATEQASNIGPGSVYELAAGPGGYAAVPTILATFNRADGADPLAGLLADGAGNLFGTTFLGGQFGNGAVYEVARGPGGYASTPALLASFNGTNGQYLSAPLIADAAGDLFGTADGGGQFGYGTVFEIVKTAAGYASTPTVLLNLNKTNGTNPIGGLFADANGNLFGTAEAGGAANDGTIFEIAKTASGYASTAILIASFSGPNGNQPNGTLVADAAGNLFGTAQYGGLAFNGAVFEIVKTGAGYSATPLVLAGFGGSNGSGVFGGVIIDAAGDLFGTTMVGGATGQGTVFEIVKTATGYASTPTTLVSFNGTNGLIPIGGLVADAAGNLFGTTNEGGPANSGTVFEITGAYVVACFCPGTLIMTPDGEVPVEALAIGDLVVTAEGAVEAVRWIGRRSYAGRFLAANPQARPVRLRAGSLGGGLPRRDLLVSPEHALCLDGVLVPAGCLVDGDAIAPERGVDRVDYVHVELARHGLVVAEGVASETFLDDGSRGMFHNAHEYTALYPDAPPPDGYCAARVTEGPVLEAIRARLAAVQAVWRHAA